jgi:hypothetical protein
VPAPAERFQGERQNLIGALTAIMPTLAAALPASDPVIRLVEAALRSGALDRLRVALAAASAWQVEQDALRGPAGGPWVH